MGEALVGNDAVDQLSKFNQRLIDLAPATGGGAPGKGASAAGDGAPHAIDGILLTKFDTIDDKVRGASQLSRLSAFSAV